MILTKKSKPNAPRRYRGVFLVTGLIPVLTGCSLPMDPAHEEAVGEDQQALDCNVRCDSGWDYWGNPIPINATTDGFQVCSLQNQWATCGAGGWSVGASGCNGMVTPYNTKFGVNSAASFDEGCAQESNAAAMGMGYYLEIAYGPGDLSKVAQSMQCAIQNRIIPIVRICDAVNACGFADVNTYVSFLQQLDDQVGGLFYAVAGPNEPLSEKWIPGTENIVWNGGYTQQQLSTLGQKNAQYMNEVISGVGSRRHSVGGHVGLISPVFNCTDPANSDFVYWMSYHGANFSGLDVTGGNAYNVNTSQGLTITKYVADCRNAFTSRGIPAPQAFFLTEMGAWESDKNPNPSSPRIPHAQALANLESQVDMLRMNPDMRAALFFNGFGTNLDPNFDYGVISGGEWTPLLDGGLTLPAPSCGKLTVQEDFDAVPQWSSWFDAPWGSAATWQTAPSGQSGAFLNAIRDSEGSSARVEVYDISPGSDYTISIYMKGASRPSVTYWVETAYKLGEHTAQDFDQNSQSWNRVRRFTNTTLDGNGNVWTRYQKTFHSGTSTRISVGFKTGSQGGIAPSARWDTLRIE